MWESTGQLSWCFTEWSCISLEVLARSQRSRVTDLITLWHFLPGMKDGISRIFWGVREGPEERRNFFRFFYLWIKSVYAGLGRRRRLACMYSIFSNSKMTKYICLGSQCIKVLKVYVLGHFHLCNVDVSFLVFWVLAYLSFSQSCTKCMFIYIFKGLETNRCEILSELKGWVKMS